MQLPDVRRLAALDIHGVAGTRLRRELVRAEFVLGGVVGVALGAWVAVAAPSVAGQVFGAWMAGVGVNYGVLAWYAASLSRRGALTAELADVNVTRELRRYTYLQFWVVVPLAFIVLAHHQRAHH
jgi:hypothetical protein